LHNVLHIFLPKRFSIPHNVLMQPKSFSNLRGAELFRNRQVTSSTLVVGSILSITYNHSHCTLISL
jgi:hypothetical protein